MPVTGEYEFVADTTRVVGISRSPFLLVGTLNAQGDFIQEHKLEGLLSRSGMPAFTMINSVGMEPRKVYEYRSGRLIRGELSAKYGAFVPEVGAAVIKFEDYRYGRDLPIWNLPGSFKKIEKPTDAKDAKK